MVGQVKQLLFEWPIRLKGGSKCTSHITYSLSLLAAQNKNLAAAPQTLLAGVKILCVCNAG